MNIHPLFDRVLVEITNKNTPQKTGALILPETSQDKPLLGKIIATGDGKMADGESVLMQVEIGDLILFNKYSGNEIKENGKNLVLLRQSEILAKIEGENK